VRRKKGNNVINLQDSNLRLLLELLYAKSCMTRQDMAEATGLSASGISKLVGFLLDKGLVVEEAFISRRKGRRAISLRLNGDSVYAVGVRLARNYLTCGLFNFSGEILYSIHREIETKQLAETTQLLSELIGATLKEAERINAPVYGIGVSAPGPLFPYDGRLVLITDYPEWQGFSVKKFCEENFGLRTILEHDANVSVLAEKWFGGGKDCDQLIYVVADRGVGAGVYTNGYVHTGSQNIAGEIGHTTIKYDGEKCECGNRGCLELYSSSTAVLKEARQIWEAERPSGWSEQMTIDKLAQLAQAGCEHARQLLTKAGNFLGIGLANLLTTYNPEKIIVGDEMTRAGDIWFSAVKNAVKERALPEVYANTKIEVSQLEIEPAFLGTGLLVLRLVVENVSSISTFNNVSS